MVDITKITNDMKVSVQEATFNNDFYVDRYLRTAKFEMNKSIAKFISDQQIKGSTKDKVAISNAIKAKLGDIKW